MADQRRSVASSHELEAVNIGVCLTLLELNSLNPENYCSVCHESEHNGRVTHTRLHRGKTIYSRRRTKETTPKVRHKSLFYYEWPCIEINTFFAYCTKPKRGRCISAGGIFYIQFYCLEIFFVSREGIAALKFAALLLPSFYLSQRVFFSFYIRWFLRAVLLIIFSYIYIFVVKIKKGFNVYVILRKCTLA